MAEIPSKSVLTVHPKLLLTRQRIYAGSFEGDDVVVKVVEKNDFNEQEETFLRKTHASEMVAQLVTLKRENGLVYLAFEKYKVKLETFAVPDRKNRSSPTDHRNFQLLPAAPFSRKSCTMKQQTARPELYGRKAEMTVLDNMIHRIVNNNRFTL